MAEYSPPPRRAVCGHRPCTRPIPYGRRCYCSDECSDLATLERRRRERAAERAIHPRTALCRQCGRTWHPTGQRGPAPLRCWRCW